jgi:predicted CXXCH cytochrome family protein
MSDCLQCHDEHASNEPALLDQNLLSLCSSCHADVLSGAENCAVKHSAVTEGRACLNCHSPHEGTTAALLNDQPLQTCLTCHSKETLRKDGSKIASVAALADPKQQLHAPVASGNCRECHDVHGGSRMNLLTKPLSTLFYQPPDPQAQALCFSCHDAQMLEAKTTMSVTRFRNGQTNLHYLHITAQGDSARNCRVCHATHSSEHARQMRPAVPFGQWEVPIRFQATDTGGSCGAGCHRATSYDRESPVSYP